MTNGQKRNAVFSLPKQHIPHENGEYYRDSRISMVVGGQSLSTKRTASTMHLNAEEFRLSRVFGNIGTTEPVTNLFIGCFFVRRSGKSREELENDNVCVKRVPLP